MIKTSITHPLRMGAIAKSSISPGNRRPSRPRPLENLSYRIPGRVLLP